MLLEAHNIGLRHPNGHWLFRNLSISLRSGEIVGIRGPSGCGKTSFARILSGYEQPSEGVVLLDNSPLPKTNYHPVQLIYQHPEKAVNHRWKMSKILNEGWTPDDHLLTSLGIEREWLNRWPNELSGGELQRFCVARALGPKTKFLIADEMTTMLDAISQAQIWQSVLDIAQKRNLGILVVSHDDHLLKRVCSRVIEFHNISYK
ncbi:ABC transporter ATP-binding protein [Anaerobacillus arseniciselenatis]|uniref:ABC transporter ATP-binding protein n=1 Tax=Anaerobacillus arseniciselenatis TaxID=85682 RepID=A0A1S2L9H2_9BACI|nr:ATP-binding cassette domain-containing protein [Anaerobacillus arseniciselenatis]OIJ08215.1 ABC transporter ATP-binding protein [Anaerobacillus arseniciselenatis]